MTMHHCSRQVYPCFYLFIYLIAYYRIGFDSPTNSINRNQTNQEAAQHQFLKLWLKRLYVSSLLRALGTFVLDQHSKTNNLEFELEPSLINIVQATPFSGKAHEDVSAHLQNFLEIRSIVTIKDVS
jgi:hypothetical protein